MKPSVSYIITGVVLCVNIFMFGILKIDFYNLLLSLLQVVSGHTGWVRCIAVEPGNQWYCTGSADRTIKV